MKRIPFLFFAFCVLLGQGGHASLVIGDFDKGDLLSARQQNIAATVSIEYETVFHLPVKITDAKVDVTEITRDAKGNTTKTGQLLSYNHESTHHPS